MNTLDDADICDTHGHIALQSGAARPAAEPMIPVIAMSSPAGNALPPPVGSLSTPPACFCPLEDDDEDILRATPPPCPRHPYPGPAASPCSPGSNPGHACDLSTFNDCGGYRSPSPDAPEQRLVPRSSPPKATRSASIERHAPRGESPPPRGGPVVRRTGPPGSFIVAVRPQNSRHELLRRVRDFRRATQGGQAPRELSQ
ncbi:hypothetical protein FS749_008589 [Ceratobasidium sp. UAMH 11750]|nr:hypothetical protein FS749_008589 [Ceratobasidium sp. UAMH 11750]